MMYDLELCLGLTARATRDVDTLFRGTAEEFEQAVDEALAEPWGAFRLERTALERIVKAPRLVKPYRFDVKLIVQGKTWRRVQVEVSFPDGHAAEFIAPVDAPTVGFFGIQSPAEIVGIALDYQVGQKMHAASDPDIPPDIINDRVRDIIDLILVKNNFYAADPAPATLRAACLDVFRARADEATALGRIPRHWPPIFAANAAWQRAYPDLAESVGITLTLEEAIDIVQNWADNL